MGPPTAPLAPIEVLERSARGDPVDPESVRGLVRAWVDGVASDAQMAAWCAVACSRGLGEPSVDALTRGLVGSGQRLELASLGSVGAPLSTGAVGDSVPLLAPPIAAALGVRVVATAEPGVAHAGGPLDKLAAIPGFRTDLPLDRFVRQVRDVGIAVAGPGQSLAPADARLTTLRDQTGTVRSPALMAASLMSRAIAAGATAIVVDVRAGAGGLLPTVAEAVRAARAMEALASPWGRDLRWLVTSADAPLGRFVGNALEVREAGKVLRGGGPDDLRELAVRVAGEVAELAGVAPAGEGLDRASTALDDGSALKVAEAWIEAQDGDPSVWTNPATLPRAPIERPVDAPRSGVIESIAARGVGEAARWLGVGRLHAQQTVDPVPGVEFLSVAGEEVTEGEPFAVVHARDPGLAARAADMVVKAVVVGDAPVEAGPLVLEAGGHHA